MMLELRIRACHVHGRFIAKDNVRPQFTLKDAMEHPTRDVSRIVLPPGELPARAREDRDAVARGAAVHRVEHELNEFFAEGAQDFGIILQGGMYNTTVSRRSSCSACRIRSATLACRCYVLNVTYPLVDDEIARFCSGKRAVLVIEEGQPDFIEQNLHSMLRKADSRYKVHGKDVLPMAGEYTAAAVIHGSSS